MLNITNPFEDIILLLQEIRQDQDTIKSILLDKKERKSDELLTTAQAREYLKCSAGFLWKLRRDNKIKALNAGKKILFPKTSLNEYLQLKKGGGK